MTSTVVPDSLLVRNPKQADVQEIVRLASPLLGDGEADLRERVERCLALGAAECFVAMDGPELVGVLLASYNGFHFVISHLIVKDSHRNVGVRRALHESLVRRAEAVRAVAIITSSPVSTVSLYHHLGYGLPSAVFMVRPVG